MITIGVYERIEELLINWIDDCGSMASEDESCMFEVPVLFLYNDTKHLNRPA